jgi:hypothetical protein
LRSGSLGTTASIEIGTPTRPANNRSASSYIVAAEKDGKMNWGPSLVAVSQTEGIEMEGIYLNHAPCFQTLRIKNISDGKRILLRLGSDLGRGLTFLRKKRSGPEPKEGVVYPTNTVKWAKADGLHPTRLRDIRHMLANLESSDSHILEAGVEEDVFISFRPSENEQSRLQAPPRSPTPNSESNKQSTSQDDSYSLQGSLAALDISLSPRSAPELSHVASADSPYLFKTVDASGSISLRASVLSTADAVGGDDGINLEPISSSASNMSSSSSSRPASYYSSNVSSSTSTSAAMTGGMGNPAVQEIELPFHASYCRPQLAVTKHQHRNKLQSTGMITLDFGDIFVGQSLEMDLYLHRARSICSGRPS